MSEGKVILNGVLGSETSQGGGDLNSGFQVSALPLGEPDRVAESIYMYIEGDD